MDRWMGAGQVFSPPIADGSIVGELLEQLAERISARLRWRPIPAGRLKDLFESGPALLSDTEMLTQSARLIRVSSDFGFTSARVNNAQYGETPLVQIRKTGWAKDASDPSAYSESNDAHFELQWLRLNDEERTPVGLSVELHFETSPYLTRSHAKRLTAEYASFRDVQKGFRERFLEEGPGFWRRPRAWGWVNVATLDPPALADSDSYWLSPNANVSEAAQLISAAIEAASPTVSTLLEEIRSTKA